MPRRANEQRLRVDLDLDRGSVAVVCDATVKAQVVSLLCALPGALLVKSEAAPTLVMPVAGLCESQRDKLTREAGRNVRAVLRREGLL